MRILVIDDNTDIRQFLKEALGRDGFIVDTAGDGAEGSRMGRWNEYDLIILDYIMPRKNGLRVLKEIRESGRTNPIIMLSVQDEIDDKVNVLDYGADDYMTKPFSYKELVARIRALLRRPEHVIPSTLKIADLTLNPSRQSVTRGDKEIQLTKKEFALTEYLMRNQGSIVSRGMLMEHVWNDGVDAFSNTIESHMRNLRKKIDGDSPKKLIQTVSGRGYKIDAHRMIFR